MVVRCNNSIVSIPPIHIITYTQYVNGHLLIFLIKQQFITSDSTLPDGYLFEVKKRKKRNENNKWIHLQRLESEMNFQRTLWEWFVVQKDQYATVRGAIDQ